MLLQKHSRNDKRDNVLAHLHSARAPVFPHCTPYRLPLLVIPRIGAAWQNCPGDLLKKRRNIQGNDPQDSL